MLSILHIAVVIVVITPVALFAQQSVTTPGGSANSVAKFSGATTVIPSAISEANGNVTIGTSSTSSALGVFGGITASQSVYSQGSIFIGNNNGAANNQLYLSAGDSNHYIYIPPAPVAIRHFSASSEQALTSWILQILLIRRLCWR